MGNKYQTATGFSTTRLYNSDQHVMGPSEAVLRAVTQGGSLPIELLSLYKTDIESKVARYEKQYPWSASLGDELTLNLGLGEFNYKHVYAYVSQLLGETTTGTPSMVRNGFTKTHTTTGALPAGATEIKSETWLGITTITYVIMAKIGTLTSINFYTPSYAGLYASLEAYGVNMLTGEVAAKDGSSNTWVFIKTNRRVLGSSYKTHWTVKGTTTIVTSSVPRKAYVPPTTEPRFKVVIVNATNPMNKFGDDRYQKSMFITKAGYEAYLKTNNLTPPKEETMGAIPPTPIRTANTSVFPNGARTAEGPGHHKYPTAVVEVKQVEKMLDIFGLDLEELTKEIESNPDIASLEEVSIRFDIDIATEDEYCKRYLFEFLNFLYQNDKRHPDVLNMKRGVEIYYNEYALGVRSSIFGQPIQNKKFDNTYGKNHTVGDVKILIEPSTKAVSSSTIQYTRVTLVKQIAKNRQHKIVIHDLYRSVTDYSVDAAPDDRMKYMAATSNVTIDDTVSDDYKGELGMPICSKILHMLKAHEQNVVLTQSVNISAFAVKHKYIKWYKRKQFINFVSFVLKVIGIVLLIMYGIDFNAAVAEFGFMSALGTAIEGLLITFSITQALIFIMDKMGVLGTILAVVAAVIIMMKTGTGGKILQDLVKTAEDMLRSVTMLFTAAKESYTNDIEQLEEEINSGIEDYNREKDRLDELQAGLDSESSKLLGDPLLVIRRNRHPIPFESPSNFYNRSIHVKNPGVLSVSTISTYVASMKKLPNFVTSQANLQRG